MERRGKEGNGKRKRIHKLRTYVVIESYDCAANMCIKIIWRDLPADKYVHLKLEDLSVQPQPATDSDKSREHITFVLNFCSSV